MTLHDARSRRVFFRGEIINVYMENVNDYDVNFIYELIHSPLKNKASIVIVIGLKDQWDEFLKY